MNGLTLVAEARGMKMAFNSQVHAIKNDAQEFGFMHTEGDFFGDSSPPACKRTDFFWRIEEVPEEKGNALPG